MPSESWSSNPTIPHKSLESLKETFKQRLDIILHKQLTIENIETFADEALSETVKLTDDILAEYRTNPNVYPNQIPLNNQVQEDDAFAILGLPNINEILQSITEVKDSIDSLKKYINIKTENEDTVITPPQADLGTKIEGGSGIFVEKKMFPRLLTLMYILEHDFDLLPTDIHITQGAVTPDMIRKTPYVRVEIPDLERVVYICDEEGNASYVFDTAKLIEQGLTLLEIDIDDKGGKNSLIASHYGIGIRIVQSPNWRTHVAENLREPIPEMQTGIKNKQKIPEKGKLSEFREKKEWLSFDEFQAEVRDAYPKKGDISRWYRKEKLKHANWPSRPDETYKDTGWIGWPELVGKENFLKKEFLSFEIFQDQVRLLYPGEGAVVDWYRKEQKNHKDDWPSTPDMFYKDTGWRSWSELAGKEKEKNKEFLSFNDFQTEVRSLYPGERNAARWYREEQKKHPSWASNPDKIYKDKGWKGFRDLIGKK